MNVNRRTSSCGTLAFTGSATQTSTSRPGYWLGVEAALPFFITSCAGQRMFHAEGEAHADSLAHSLALSNSPPPPPPPHHHHHPSPTTSAKARAIKRVVGKALRREHLEHFECSQ